MVLMFSIFAWKAQKSEVRVGKKMVKVRPSEVDRGVVNRRFRPLRMVQLSWCLCEGYQGVLLRSSGGLVDANIVTFVRKA